MTTPTTPTASPAPTAPKSPTASVHGLPTSAPDWGPTAANRVPATSRVTAALATAVPLGFAATALLTVRDGGSYQLPVVLGLPLGLLVAPVALAANLAYNYNASPFAKTYRTRPRSSAACSSRSSSARCSGTRSRPRRPGRPGRASPSKRGPQP